MKSKTSDSVIQALDLKIQTMVKDLGIWPSYILLYDKHYKQFLRSIKKPEYRQWVYKSYIDGYYYKGTLIKRVRPQPLLAGSKELGDF